MVSSPNNGAIKYLTIATSSRVGEFKSEFGLEEVDTPTKKSLQVEKGRDKMKKKSRENNEAREFWHLRNPGDRGKMKKRSPARKSKRASSGS